MIRKTEPDNAVIPTPVAITIPADRGLTPNIREAHLERSAKNERP